MTIYTYDLGAGGVRVVKLDKNSAWLDGASLPLLDAFAFMRDAAKEGIRPIITDENGNDLTPKGAHP